MRNPRLFLVTAIASFAATGCVASRAYVDPTLPKVKYAELALPTSPTPVAVDVKFLSNGVPNEEATNFLKHQIIKTLETSRLFSRVDARAIADGETVLKIVMETKANKALAVPKGFVTGSSFIAGTTVTDGYEFAATLQSAGRPAVEKHYIHAIHTTTGNAKATGLTPMTVREAILQVIEQPTLNTLRDLQRDGVLPEFDGKPGSRSTQS